MERERLKWDKSGIARMTAGMVAATTRMIRVADGMVTLVARMVRVEWWICLWFICWYFFYNNKSFPAPDIVMTTLCICGMSQLLRIFA